MLLKRYYLEKTRSYILQVVLFAVYTVHYLSKCSIPVFIIWLAPRTGKMKQILHSGWLPEQARWAYLAVMNGTEHNQPMSNFRPFFSFSGLSLPYFLVCDPQIYSKTLLVIFLCYFFRRLREIKYA